jgi:YHS domain-containing protein
MKSLATAALLICSLFAVPSFAAEKDAAKDKKAATPINKKCPVEHGEVDPEVTVQHEGKTIGFCCAGCDTEFKKDPAKYMAVIAKEEAPAKDAEKDKKDAKKKDEAKKKAELNTKCPVTGDEADKTITTEYKGRTVAFCCEPCIEDFDKDPKKYIDKLDKEAAKSGEKKKDDAEREKEGKKK